MKNLLLLLALFLSFGAQAQRELPRLKEPKQSKVDKDVWNVTNNGMFWLKYEQPKEMLELFNKEANLKLWTPEQKAQELAKLPLGGWLQCRVSGTLAESDPNTLTFVIQNEKGEELQRFQPEHGVGAPSTVMGHTFYYSPVNVPLRQPLNEGFKVFVISDYNKTRLEFLIRPL